MSKITQAQELRNRMNTVRMQVLQVLGWSELELNTFVEERGRDYLRFHFGHAPLVDRIPEYREYWSWWRLHWMQRDVEFLNLCGMLFPHEMSNYYRDMHNPLRIKHSPQGEILAASYERMIHALIKKQVTPDPCS